MIKTTKTGNWIFSYIRADMEEIDMGFYETAEDALKASKEMASFGAIVNCPMEVDGNHKLYKGE